MRKALLLTALGGLLAAAPLGATPTRILTIDNGNLIVPDDWDGTYYYSLAPNFKDHLYFDTYSDGSSFGWAFLDLKVATLVLWWNKPFEAGALYTASAGTAGALGYSLADQSANTLSIWEPKEKRLKAPDNKAALGLAVPISDSLNLGFCFRYAELYDSQEGTHDVAGGFFGPTQATYLIGAGPYAAENLSTTSYANVQAANGLVLSPQLSYQGESINFDVKLDLVWAGVDNKHNEKVTGASGTGEITQTLKEKGTMNWQLKPRLRYMLDSESSLVLKGYYNKLGFDTEHRVKGGFAGSGFSAIQLAGYDHADSTHALGVDMWEAIVGYLKTWERGKHSFVLGGGGRGETDKVLGKAYQIAGSATTYNDLVLARRIDATVNKLEIPIFMGAELGLTPWAKARGMVSRNFYSLDSTTTIDESFDSAGALSSKTTTKTADDLNPAWTVAMGFGLNFGSFSWDTALNTGLLGSAKGAAFVNPIYQSSFTYGF